VVKPEIVRRVEGLFALADQLEERVPKAEAVVLPPAKFPAVPWARRSDGSPDVDRNIEDRKMGIAAVHFSVPNVRAIERLV
jgi:hypothetical protein